MQDQEQEGKKRRLPEDMRGVVEKRERAAQKMAAWQGSRAGAWPSWSLLHPSRLRLPTLCWLATWMRTPPVNKTPTPRWVVGKNETEGEKKCGQLSLAEVLRAVTTMAPHRGPGGASPSGPLRISTCSGATSAWGWTARQQSDDAITAMAWRTDVSVETRPGGQAAEEGVGVRQAV